MILSPNLSKVSILELRLVDWNAEIGVIVQRLLIYFIYAAGVSGVGGAVAASGASPSASGGVSAPPPISAGPPLRIMSAWPGMISM